MNQPNILSVKQQIFNTTLALYKVTERALVDEPLRNRLREKGVELMMLVQDVFSGKIINSDICSILRQEFDSMCFLLEFGRFYTSINPANFSVLIQSYQALWKNIDNFMKISLESSPEESLQKLLSGVNDPVDDFIANPLKTTTPATSASESVDNKDNKNTKETDKNITIKNQERAQKVVQKDPEKTLEKKSTSDKSCLGKQVLRQQKIIGILEERALSNFQLKDILSEFPNFNEKTVRNDLKVLCESGILKRDGAGRSSTYKIIRQISSS